MILKNSDNAQSDAAHEAIDTLAEQIIGLGFDDMAPWRMMAWKSFDELRSRLTAQHAREDLLRLRAIIDRHLAELEEVRH